MTDPRIDPLGNSSILTDTVMRLAFAPVDKDAKITALKVPVRVKNVQALDAAMLKGTIHLQIKAGFGFERTIEMSPAELMIFIDMADRFITELPQARKAEAQPDA